MNKFFRTRRQPYARTAMLQYQKKLIEEHYEFLNCRIEKNVLICRGTIISPNFSQPYSVEIRCVCGYEPSTKILAPADIMPNKDIHMYDDHTLCLHYPPDMKWTERTSIYRYTIPWLIEWITYYEIYLINGRVWEGPESPTHITEFDKNRTEDIDLSA
jgi:hypothetical protein